MAAGIAAFQNEKYWYFLGTRQTPAGAEMFLERQKGGAMETLARTTSAAKRAAALKLRIRGDGASLLILVRRGRQRLEAAARE